MTRDYGAEQVLEASESSPAESETVIRFLDREAEITTRYGGGFIQSIDGTSGEVSDGRSSDWFFFVNGTESPTGAAEVPVEGGDRVWWDYRDWSDAISTPFVVGSWPEPFLQGSAGTDLMPVRIECEGDRAPCDLVRERLSDEGADASIERAGAAGPEGADALRLLVGPWSKVGSDPAAATLERGPQTSGVFARFAAGGTRLEALDDHATAARRLGAGAGLVAGVRHGDDPAIWVVTGTDARGVEAAADLLDADDLRDRYAVAATPDGALALPVAGDG